MQQKQYSNRYILLIGLMATIVLMFSPQLCKADAVAARLAKAGSNKAVIMINLKASAPSTLIVFLRLPANITVVKTTPRADKINSKKGTITWLLKNTTPGTVSVNFSSAQSFRLDEVSASVRYRDPNQGLTEIEAAHSD
ncbi:MAG: hypothetical protein HKP41_12515 [Desulfobacterales bacterium]|nr:hypothetical protein [Desulfobacterales bacterium]